MEGLPLQAMGPVAGVVQITALQAMARHHPAPIQAVMGVPVPGGLAALAAQPQATPVREIPEGKAATAAPAPSILQAVPEARAQILMRRTVWVAAVVAAVNVPLIPRKPAQEGAPAFMAAAAAGLAGAGARALPGPSGPVLMG